MERLLVEIRPADSFDIVDTRNDQYGRLRMYYDTPKPSLRPNTTVSFALHTSAMGNVYAKFISVVERNHAIFNTEDRSQWYTLGEDEEADFIRLIVPQIHLDIRKNPEKEYSSYAI